MVKKESFIFNKGIAGIYVTILVLAIGLAIATTIFVLTYNEQKISENSVKSAQAYYAAEAGCEDALLRLENSMTWNNPYTLLLGNASTTVDISDIVGSSRTISCQGNSSNRLRKIQVNYEIATEKASFYYGAQVGEGGVQMDDGSTINGNVFSNGSITAANNTEITGTVKVAQTGNKILGANIGEDAYVDICENSDIIGTLTTANNINCTASLVESLTEEITISSFPITDQKINDWKSEALSGGTIVGDYILSAKQIDYLGPIKIEGNMTIQNLAQLYITGTIWVTGNITIQDGAKVRLDKNTYELLSGVLVGDSDITLQNNALALGSGEPGSYLLTISTDTGSSAITVQDDFEADILFAPHGWIIVQNTTRMREVTGYGLHLKNNTVITYEVGLENVSFSSGPGGGWEATNWKEIE